MIAGHLGIALGARAMRPKALLVWLLAASIVPDILDGVYALAKVCSPFGTYSHSLPAIAVLAAITMVLAYAGTRNGAIALVFGLVVLAHVRRTGSRERTRSGCTGRWSDSTCIAGRRWISWWSCR